MNPKRTSVQSSYQRDQWLGFLAIKKALDKMRRSDISRLLDMTEPYMQFRANLDAFQKRYFETMCRESCYVTGLSACCGFESIFTFFADQVINLLYSNQDRRNHLFEVLERPNRTLNCVFLEPSGCLWVVRPIGCAMYYCDNIKKAVFQCYPKAKIEWRHLREREKDFTRPTKPVLFDALEKEFIRMGVDTPHMYLHKSPGLLRLKANYGVR